MVDPTHHQSTFPPRALTHPCSPSFRPLSPLPLNNLGQLMEMLTANLFGMLNISALLLLVSPPPTFRKR